MCRLINFILDNDNIIADRCTFIIQRLNSVSKLSDCMLHRFHILLYSISIADQRKPPIQQIGETCNLYFCITIYYA